jgi:hypothetical protein
VHFRIFRFPNSQEGDRSDLSGTILTDACHRVVDSRNDFMPFGGCIGPNCGIDGRRSPRAIQMPATAGKICKIAGIIAVPAAILLAVLNRT